MRRARVYPYRWAVLIALMSVALVCQMQWLALAPIARAANNFYANQGVDFLALVFFLVFIIISLHYAVIYKKLGQKWTLRLASLLLIIFSLLKGVASRYYWVVLLSQGFLAVSYSLILNSVSLVSERWFALPERGFAVALVVLAQFLGLILVMAVNPRVVVNTPSASNYGAGVEHLQFYLALVSVAVSLVAFFLFRERPPTPAGKEEGNYEKLSTSFKAMFAKKSMVGFIPIFALVWGLFYALIAQIDSLATFIGVENSNGVAGLIILGAGMLGSLVIPYLSDYFRKRKLFFFFCLSGLFLGFLAFALLPLMGHALIFGYIATGFIGFFFQSAISLGFQWATELSYPTKETSVQSVLLWSGHLSGAVFLTLMSVVRVILWRHVVVASVVLLFISTLGLLFVQESPVIVTEEEKFASAMEEE